MLNNILLYATSFVLFGITIPKVIATDCDIYVNVAKYLGSDYKTRYSKATNCCTFTGIKCDAQNNIVEVKITGVNGISVMDPVDMESAVEEMKNLKSLTSLEISNTVYFNTGSWNGMPRSIGNLVNLKKLVFNSNNIGFSSKPLPDELGNLINLETLNLNHAIVTGNFPELICKFTKLKYLDIGGNDIKGVIPYECKNLINLEYIDVSSSFHVEGYLPILPNLKSCKLDLSDVCTLPESQCQSDKQCSTQDIINTNAANGNPDPTSDKYEGYTGKANTNKSNSSSSSSSSSILSSLSNKSGNSSNKSKDDDNDDDNLSYIYRLLKVISAFIAVITALCSLWYYFKRAKSSKTEDSKPQINIININDSSASSESSNKKNKNKRNNNNSNNNDTTTTTTTTNNNNNNNTNTNNNNHNHSATTMNSTNYPSQTTTQQLHPLQTYASPIGYSPQQYSPQQYSPQPYSPYSPYSAQQYSPYYNATLSTEAPPQYSTLPKYTKDDQTPFIYNATLSEKR